MREQLLDLLRRVEAGELSAEQAAADPALVREADLGFAVLDEQRTARTGLPEVVYGEGKTPEQVTGILGHLLQRGQRGLATRIRADVGAHVVRQLPGTRYEPVPRLLLATPEGLDELPEPRFGPVWVVSAGTSDLPVAEEAAWVARWFGMEVHRAWDVGVAGLHRLHSRIDDLRSARVLIVAAGMEGALPTVVAGLVSAPVIAVPTSAGYGASFGGLAALLGMVNSCAGGVAVVNIDNGFGAAQVAWRILASGDR